MTVFRNVRLLDYFDNRCDRGTRLTKAERLPGTIPLVTAGVENKGVAQYIAHNKQLFDKDSITIDMFGNTFYRNYEFYADDNILILHKQVYSKNILLYFTGAISQATYGRFSYAKQFRQKILQNLIVSLPFTDSGQLDIQYMEQYIKRVEADYTKRVEADYTKRVEAYLAMLGYESLDDCELSSRDLKVLSGPDEWGEFRIGSLFDIYKTKSLNKASLTVASVNDKYPYVTRTIYHNGVESYTGFIDKVHLNPANTFSLGLLQMNFRIQKEPWYAGQFVRLIVPKVELTNKQMLYFNTLFNKFSQLLDPQAVKSVDNKFLNGVLRLPVTSDGKPDYSFMDQYITVIEKKKVLKLKQAMDHKLELYRSVSHQN